MPHDWRTAFLAQAESDYRMLHLLNQSQTAERCHRLHYLQMAAEKTAKAFATRGSTRPPARHPVVADFVHQAHLVKGLQRTCKMRNSAQFKQYLASLKPLAKQLDELVPEKQSQRPNTEYPWERAGAVHAPCDHDFPEWHWERDKPKVVRMMEFINACLRLT